MEITVKILIISNIVQALFNVIIVALVIKKLKLDQKRNSRG